MNERYRISIKGYLVSEEVVEEMLRYDGGGTVETLETIGKQLSGIVVSKRYTPDRWLSFGVRTEILGRI